jgi:ABC-type Fe3+ transport system substrate-binding protein
VAAKLGVADLLKNGPKPCDELAEATQSDPGSLRRLLRLLASAGVFAETDDSQFHLTPMAECLMSDGPNSMRAWATMIGEDWHWRMWGELLYTVRTGKPAFDLVHGMRPFEYFPRNPDSARIFDEAMTGLSASEVGAILGAYDFSKYKKIIDVAGGNGSLIIPLLKISLAKLPASLIDSLDQRRRPPFDLVWCNTVPALRMAEQGHCNPLSEELAPNLKDLAARARPAQAPIEGFSPFVSPYVVHYVMAYREEAFPHGKPDSWEVMLEPGYKGKVALYPGGNGFFPIAQALGGGSPDGIPNNMTPCWEFFHRLKPQVGHLGYSIGMGDLIRKGELDICFRALTNAIAFKDEGLAVSWVAPKEGITDTADALWIPRGVPDDVVFWSQRYINFALSL